MFKFLYQIKHGYLIGRLHLLIGQYSHKLKMEKILTPFMYWKWKKNLDTVRTDRNKTEFPLQM